VTRGDRKLSPEQDKAIERIQVTGLLLNLGLGTAMAVLASRDVIDYSKALVIAVTSMIALVSVMGLLVSRVEGQAFTEVLRRAHRQMRVDLKAAPARLLQRLKGGFRRSRPR